MRIIIVSHGYAPALNARAFRWTALAEYWAARGHDVHVVTVRSQGAASMSVVNGVNVHRVGFYLDRIGLAARQSGHGPTTSGGGTAGGGLKSILLRPLVRAAKVVHDLTWKKVYWPDYAAPWIPFAAAKTRELLAVDPRSAVISVSLPFSGHVAAYRGGAPQHQGAWIVDIGDPFSFMTETPTNNHALYRSRNAAAESRMVKLSTAVTVTSDHTRTEYVRLFGEAARIKVIPPMLSVDKPNARGASLSPQTTLVYVGTLNRRIRNPDRLLALFSALAAGNAIPALELHFYGETGDCSAILASLDPAIATRVHVHGLVSRDAALEAARDALAVVNIGNATHFQLPSKLVEYVRGGRPILNLSSGPRDSSVEFLNGVPGVLTLDGSQSLPDEVQRLENFLKSYRDASPGPVPEHWFSRFTLETVAAAYEELFTPVKGQSSQ